MGKIYTSKDVSGDHFEVTFENLNPVTKYEARVYAIVSLPKEEFSSNPAVSEKYTLPIPPLELRVIKVGNYDVSLQWKPPPMVKGAQLDDYVVRYSEEESGTSYDRYTAKETQYTVSGLSPGTSYKFSVKVKIFHFY